MNVIKALRAWALLVACLVLLQIFQARSVPVSTQANAKNGTDNFVYSGQELGVSTYQKGKRELRLGSKVTEITGTDGAGYKSLRTEKKTTNGSVATIYKYDANDVLTGIVITAPSQGIKPIFETLKKDIKEATWTLNNYRKGNGELDADIQPQVVPDTNKKTNEQQKLSVITIRSDKLIEAQSLSRSAWFSIFIGITVLLWIYFGSTKDNFKSDGDNASKALSTQDFFVSSLLLTSSWFAFGITPITWPVSIYLLYFAVLGAWRGLSWLIGSARVIRYPQYPKLWHSFAALPLAPFVIGKAVVRNSLKSSQYFGLVVLHVQMAVIAFIGRPAPQAVCIVFVLFLLSGGITRLYANAFSFFKPRSGEVGAAVSSNLFWLCFVAYGIVQLVLTMVTMLLYRIGWLLVLGFIGLCFDSPWIGLLIGICIVTLPVLVVFGGSGVTATGYGSSTSANNFNFNDPGFSDLPMVNPATGLIMMGGMGGIDAGGNMFGSDMNTFHDYNNGFD